MGKVKYATGIDYVSGSLAKPKVKDGHSCGTYLTGTHRKAATLNPNCTRLYIREADTYKRTTPIGEDEIWARQRFTAVSRAVNTRAKNLSTISQDQAAFAAQKESVGGYKTFKSWLWAQEGETYDTAHPKG